jgi:uncharacterized membrane protein
MVENIENELGETVPLEAPLRPRYGRDGGRRGAMALGWLSLGLGLTQVLASRTLARAVRRKRRERGARLARTAAAVVGISLADALAIWRLRRRRVARGGATHRGIRVVKAVTINCSPEEAYAFCHDLENFPRFVTRLESVAGANGRSHWRAKGPAGMAIEWDAITATDRANEIIAWRSIDGDANNQAVLRFRRAPGGRGTEVRVELDLQPKVGAVAAKLARVADGGTARQLEINLMRLKQMIETGGVVHSDASIHPGLHPAKPPEVVPEHIREERIR